MCKYHYTECSKYKTPIPHTHLDKLKLCFCSKLFLSKFMKKLNQNVLSFVPPFFLCLTVLKTCPPPPGSLLYLCGSFVISTYNKVSFISVRGDMYWIPLYNKNLSALPCDRFKHEQLYYPPPFFFCTHTHAKQSKKKATPLPPPPLIYSF